MDIGEVAHHGPEDIFVALMTLIGSFVIMLTIDVKLALITFCVIPIIFVLTIYSTIKCLVLLKVYLVTYLDLTN